MTIKPFRKVQDMKIPSITNFTKIVCAASLLSLSFGASAATTWAVSDFLDGANATTALAKNVSGWSTTGTNNTFATACLHEYSSGWGVINSRENNGSCDAGTGAHAADNGMGVDLFFIEFDSAVNLTNVKIGWNGTDNYSKDSDISVLAYTGTSSTAPISGLKISNLTNSTNGWTSIGNYANVGAMNGNSAQVSTDISSSWWLISAYNSNYGGNTITDGRNIITDYFKLLSVAGTVTTTSNETPEPSSLALAALGLLSIAGFRRRGFRR
ncbi:MAG: PEP-CTERM sorting domain-containing protein [Rhodocyclaceae bacterium]|nr:PEP-CTERM sorting domain-containing protein [Rhodocyclaceae bacterium]